MERASRATLLRVALLLACLPTPRGEAQTPVRVGSPAVEVSARRRRQDMAPLPRSAPPRSVDPAVGRSRQDPEPPVPPVEASPTLAPAADGLAIALQPAPLESTDIRLPIDLASALRLADARPLVVAEAQAGVWVAEAQLQRAKVLWVPTLVYGFDYIRHDGGGPDFNKGILTAPSANFFYGGAGMAQRVNLTDAIFEPLAARRVVTSRQYDVQAAKNDALMDTADAYFEVHRARGTYAGALYSVGRGRDLVARISSLAGDLTPRIEVDRARNLTADLEQRATSAREAWRASSADLTQVLRLDPRAVVAPLEHDHLQVTLVDPGRPLDDLMPVALANRPELASNRSLVGAAQIRVRREKARPLLPILEIDGFQSAGEHIQAGIFGIGPNGSLNQWAGRDDLSYQAIWQLESFGIGNLARIKRQRGAESQARIDLLRAQDRVAAEVTEALARLQSATARVEQAERSLRTGVITFNKGYEGLGQTTRFGDVLALVNRPQEVVYALQLMQVAFEEYFGTVADYNRAQFRLFHALGYPAREVSLRLPPEGAIPVDVSRPSYLPPVGNGPPPATR